jgi:hypothetical protein
MKMKISNKIIVGIISALVFLFWAGFGSAQIEVGGPLYTNWATPDPVLEINTTQNELPNSISRDGLRLYFHRINPVTGEDLYVAQRPDTDSPWGTPVRLADGINTIYSDRTAFESPDGHWLYFASNRPGGLGGFDLYVAWRAKVHNDFAWEMPVNLTTINSPGFDAGPTLFVDDSGVTHLYFTSTPVPNGQPVLADIYESILGVGGFEPPTKVDELSSPASDARPYLRKDGREIFFQSTRNGTLCVWTSTRFSTIEPWLPPVLALSPEDLGDPTVVLVTTPVLSWNAKTLYVGVGHSSGSFDDIYVTEREKTKAPE